VTVDSVMGNEISSNDDQNLSFLVTICVSQMMIFCRKKKNQRHGDYKEYYMCMYLTKKWDSSTTIAVSTKTKQTIQVLIWNNFKYRSQTQWDQGKSLRYLKIWDTESISGWDYDISMVFETSKFHCILWNYHCSWGTNVHGFCGPPLPKNLHPHEHVFFFNLHE
jgi:hypothetical protein